MVKVVTGQGFDAESAFNNQADYSIVYNATISWQKAGKPLGEELKKFAAEYLDKKFKSAQGVGCYIVVDAPIKDTREKPFKVDNIIAEGSRKWKTFYLPTETETGNPVQFFGKWPETKAEGLTLAKELMSFLKKDITIEVVKKVVDGEPFAAIVRYTPSINTKIGSYLFFGYESN